MTKKLLFDKGFKEVRCEDGLFFVIEESNTELGNKIAKLCNLGYNSH